MSDSFFERPFPRGALLATAALIGFSLIAATTARILALNAAPVSLPVPLAFRDLIFLDAPQPQDGVAVYAVGSTQPLEILAPGSDNFIRGVLRGFARDRKSRHIGSEQPFRVAQQLDGRRTLQDLATGQSIELDAFGPTNAAAFARFLPSGNATP